MLCYFKKGKNTTKTQKMIFAVYGEGSPSDQTCQKWFVKFHAGNVSLDDAPQSGRTIEVDSNQIETLIEKNQYYALREIANILKTFKSSFQNHFHVVDCIYMMLGSA